MSLLLAGCGGSSAPAPSGSPGRHSAAAKHNSLIFHPDGPRSASAHEGLTQCSQEAHGPLMP
jgi:hypothetical protein